MVYESIHHGNTEKVAKVMADVLKAELVKAKELDINLVAEYDLLGFGSGIYWGKPHKDLLHTIDSLPSLTNKQAFVFSTSGAGKKGSNKAHQLIKGKLIEKGFTIVGEFSCRGFDSFGLLKLIGGINKGRPNEHDLKEAEDFARRWQNS